MKRHLCFTKLGNKGSAMIMVLTIISFIAVLGAMSLSTALINIRMRGINRISDKNFYYLETALDEIYAQTGRVSSEILKEEYAKVLGELYQKDMDTDEKANERLRKEFMTALLKELNVKQSDTTPGNVDNCKNAAEKLRSYAATFIPTPDGAESLTVTIDSVLINDGSSDNMNKGSADSSLLFEGLCLTYVNPETEMESALTVDLKINVPYIRFIDNRAAFLDYILVSNGEIRADSVGSLLTEAELNGNIYGETILVDKAALTANTSLMTAAGTITVRQRGGSLTILSDKDSEGESHVWADQILLDSGAELTSEENTVFYIHDDMTLTNNDNYVNLKGSYYGYGNEGNHEDGTIKETADKSSAILLNDKNSRVDLTGLDSLILAGRAYLRFNTMSENHSPYIYPMGESMAVRSTQSMYLIPAEYITVREGEKGEETEAKAAEHNPLVFPEGINRLILYIAVPADITGGEARSETYEVTRSQKDDGSAKVINLSSTQTSTPAFLVTLSGKIYVYYNFSSDRERSEYFERYLTDQGTSFEALLKKSGLTGNYVGETEKESGIFIGDNSRVVTSGSLYQVAGNPEGDSNLSFELLQTREGEVGTSLKWIDLEKQLKTSFENIKANLAETMRVKGIRQESGAASLLPMGNYVKISELNNLVQAVYVEENGCGVYLSKDSVTVNLSGAGTEIFREGSFPEKSDFTMTSGLIVSGGDVTITGSGSFDGLIMADGMIRMNAAKGGTITLNANPHTYEHLLSHEDVANYFFDYSDTSSTVLNNYEDFVIRENWRRAGRGEGAADDSESE